MDTLNEIKPQVTTCVGKTDAAEKTITKFRASILNFEERFLKLDNVDNPTYQKDQKAFRNAIQKVAAANETLMNS